MRDRWRLFAAVLAVGAAAALAVVASSHAAITITSLSAQSQNTVITGGPMGAGYDIHIVATVTDGTTWRATSWTTGGVTRCVDHSDQGNGSRTVTLAYEYEANPVLREAPPTGLPDPDKVGPSEHVFPPPPGGTSPLRVELFTNNNCSGSGLASQSINLTTDAIAPNPPLLAECRDLKVAVILDASGSIATAGATQKVRDATKALARGLVDTGASMAVFKFSSTAHTGAGDFIPPYQTITQQWVNGALTTYLNTKYNPSGTTNWDSGLRQARDQTASNRPDLVVFLTDGNPNRYGTGSTGVEEGYYAAMNPAATVANQLKTAGAHMFAIGVGDGVTDALSALRLQAVSGTRSFPEYSIETADYTLITDFNKLEEALASLASDLCNVTVTVRKETDELQSDSWVYKPGWAFSGRVLLQPPASQFAYRWFKPGEAGPPVTDTTATQSGTTQTNGTLDFVWRPTSAASLSSITITETAVPPAYAPKEVKCTSGGNTIFASTDPAVVQSFTLQGLKVRDHVYCYVRNRLKRSTVQVVKQWVGDPSSATIFVDRDGTAPYDASKVATSSGESTSFDYPVSTPATVGETAVPAGYRATIECGAGLPQAYNGGPFPVTAPAEDGATLSCTITNIQNRSTVRVVKQWEGAPASTTIFVDRDGSAPFDASTVATANGDSASFTYPTSTPVFVGETPIPAGYRATIRCGQDPAQPYTGGPFPVTAPAIPDITLTCVITNTQQLSTVRVVKDWADDPPSTATIFVDRDGAPPFDAETVATTTGDSASFTYPVSTPAFVGEVAVPSGYEATIDCGQGAQPYAGGPFPVTSPAESDETLTCTITNFIVPPELSTVRVVKQWVGAPSSATLFVDADGTAPFDAETVATANGDSASFDYPVGSQVFVGEVSVPAGYAATIHCGVTREAPQPYTGGPFAVTAPGNPGDTLTCTITNIQLFSTVRVVKVWIGDPASATIFVDQDGTAPFDASTVATATGDSASFEYPVGTPVTVGETAVPAGYRATIHCGPTREAPQPYAGGPFPVTAPTEGDATVTCEIVNIQLRSTVQVVKNWAGGAASATLFVDANGTQPFDASTVATTSGEGVSFNYAVSTPVFVGETGVPTGYTATIDCGAGPQTYSGGPFPVTSPAVEGDTLTCTITNTPHSTVRVLKYWAGPPRPTTIFVDSVGQPPFDVSTLAYADGQDVSFDYPLSTPVTVGEVGVPSGYRAFINCGTGPQDIRRYSGGPHTVVSPGVPNGVLNCTITNVGRITAPGRLAIVKTAKPRVVRAPARINFRMKATNRGPGIVRNVRVCDRVPNGLIVLRAPGARRVNGMLCWQVRVLRPRRSRNYLVVARVVTNGPRTYVNVVSVSGTNSVNCVSPAFVARRQRQQAHCTARARVVVLPARRRAAPRPPFTG